MCGILCLVPLAGFGNSYAMCVYMASAAGTSLL